MPCSRACWATGRWADFPSVRTLTRGVNEAGHALVALVALDAGVPVVLVTPRLTVEVLRPDAPRRPRCLDGCRAEGAENSA
jgi:hypothetical protein